MKIYEICSLILQTVTLTVAIRTIRKVRLIMPTLQERFDNVNSALQEATDEILAELAKLRELTLPPEAEASLSAIEAKANALKEVSPPIP